MTHTKPIDEPLKPVSSLIESAVMFINTTSSHIFLTGKAGTGKTTFLKNLAKNTHKSFLIVAPTGIAALNAGGVTIHSQFLLPHGTFLPERTLHQNFSFAGNYFAQDTLAKKHPLNSARKQVLRSIDLLVIDEVSMLRADLLDAIDYRLKAARGNFFQRFGGVQLLLIGDLYQLPPVVKREEEMLLQNYYPSPWFYEAHALRDDSFVYIELDKIFRQHDEDFISILNNLRNNIITPSDIEELNRHYRAPEEIGNLKEVITLTTHNYKADDLNLKALWELDTPSYYFDARIDGDFPESMYPAQQRLELKEGAQIMFIKNDTENKVYFNGKLATVNSISNGEIIVTMGDQQEEYILKKESWQNKKYTVNNDTRELDDEVIGTFEQYPVKLAWAITVHKSQGLTFEKAIIDVGQAFADGQVYVALSRLRSLDGLILRAPINPGAVSTNKTIVEFSEMNNQPHTLPTVLQQQQERFVGELLFKTFDFEGLEKEIRNIQKGQVETSEFTEKSMKPVLTQLLESLDGEKSNTHKFRTQLRSLLESKDTLQLLDRLLKGTQYYKNFLQENLKILLRHTTEMRKRKRVKTYLTHLTDLDQLFSKKLEEVDKSLQLTGEILQGNVTLDFISQTEERARNRAIMLDEIQKEVGLVSTPKKKKRLSKKTKGNNGDTRSTHEISLDMLKSGLNVSQIAKERSLVVSTIEGHLAKAVKEKRLSIYDFIMEEDVSNIEKIINELPQEFNSKELFNALDGKFSYGQLRAVMAHLGKESTRVIE